MVAADAELARSNAIQAGIGSLMDGVGTGLDAAGLYRTDKGMQKAALPDYNRRYAAGIESFYNSNSGFLD